MRMSNINYVYFIKTTNYYNKYTHNIHTIYINCFYICLSVYLCMCVKCICVDIEIKLN